MSDAQRERDLHALGRVLRPTYSTLEDTAFEAEVRGVHRRRQTTRRVAAVVTVTLVAVVSAMWLRPASAPVVEIASVRIASDASFTAAAGAHVRTRANDPGLLWLELERESARFDVAPQGGRLVRVSAGDVQVEVIGTAFVVTRSATDVSVRVTEGRVRVRHGAREALLSAGEAGAWPLVVAQVVAPPETPVTPPPVAVVEPVSPPPAPAPVPRSPKKAATWRALAEQGDYGGAWNALQGEGTPDDEPQDLLRAADVARLSGHPAQAIAPLRRILSRFSNDPRASLAAFTLGRVLLDELGNPKEAAEAFTQAWELGPKSPLAPDAAARAVEAHARAGEEAAAREKAERFLRDFPRSGRVDAVKRWGKVP
ncbi:MAG: tetratricopeptide repeat protein [Archangium sp.]|nr:tetratricopeptide repeat protein [Archangium sp.]